MKCLRCDKWDGRRCGCKDRQTLFLGDSREIIRELEDGSIDLTLTDPPYSSGGAMRSDRNQDPGQKYRLPCVDKVNPEFSGDNRDQRSFTLWCSDWIGAVLWKTKPGGCLLSFIDWRNLPCLIDAIQVGGFVFRAVVPWDKTLTTRPDKGWFRAQCEYVVGASAGPLLRGAECEGGNCTPGFITVAPDDDENSETFEPSFARFRVNGREKMHITEKPVGLIEVILNTRDDWQTVLDPFAGSGTTLAACKKMGRQGIGIEASEEYCEITCRRLAQGFLFA